MCGIAGLMRFDGYSLDKSELKIILDKMEHRGQDFYGITHVSHALLGHRRLSIIDLNESAAQPMFYLDNIFCLTLNGEIYNYLELKAELQKKRV